MGATLDTLRPPRRSDRKPLEPRAAELAALAARRQRERGEREARNLGDTLGRQRERIVDEFRRHEAVTG